MSDDQTSIIVRENFIADLVNDEDYPAEYLERLPQAKKDAVTKQAGKIKSGLYAIAPMKCKGPEKCPFISHCPLIEITITGEIEFGPRENYPIGYACVLESTFMRLKTIEYVQYLTIDIHNPIEMSIINDLCLIDLYKNRATIILSAGDTSGQGQDFLRIDTSQVIDTGNGVDNMIEVKSVQLHPALDVIEKLEKRRVKLIEQLHETRSQQIKRAEKQGKLKESSKLMAELDRIKKSLSESQNKSTTDLPDIPLRD